jgi:hypothetical protein
MFRQSHACVALAEHHLVTRAASPSQAPGGANAKEWIDDRERHVAVA